MYIYKLGTECDGAQMQASVVYIPTLVALLGLCFDPSECFRDLHVWSGVLGNKSSKLQYMSQIVTSMEKALLHGAENLGSSISSESFESSDGSDSTCSTSM